MKVYGNKNVISKCFIFCYQINIYYFLSQSTTAQFTLLEVGGEEAREEGGGEARKERKAMPSITREGLGSFGRSRGRFLLI